MINHHRPDMIMIQLQGFKIKASLTSKLGRYQQKKLGNKAMCLLTKKTVDKSFVPNIIPIEPMKHDKEKYLPHYGKYNMQTQTQTKQQATMVLETTKALIQ